MSKRLKGIYQNCDPVDQPEQYYRDAQNIIIDESIGAVTNEKGTVLKAAIPNGNEIIGTTLLDNDDVIVFSVQSDNLNSEIGRFSNDTYAPILNDPILSLDINESVQADFYVDKHGDRIITWVDGINPARFLNITNVPTTVTKESLNLFPSITNAPRLTVDKINNTGGRLRAGAYYFAIAYIHSDETITNFYDVVGPVNITAANNSSASSFKGSTAGERTAKSVTLGLPSVDEQYESIQIAVIPKIDGIFDEVELLPKIPIDTQVYTYTSTETTIPGALSEIQIDQAFYDKPQTVHIADDTIYLGNLEEKKDIGYQRFARDIKVFAETKPLSGGVDSNGVHDLEGSYRDPKKAIYDKSYKRGDVYAFYLSWLLKEGGESKAYHIPGRPLNTIGTIAEGSITFNEGTQAVSGTKATTDEQTVTGTATADFTLTVNVSDGQINPSVSVLNGETAAQIVSKIVSTINNGTFNYTATAPTTTSFFLTMKTVGVNTDSVTILAGNEIPPSNGIDVTPHPTSFSGGQDEELAEERKFNILFDGPNYSTLGIVLSRVYIEIAANRTIAQIASDTAAMLNADSNFSPHYTATATTGTVNIVSNAIGSAYNAEMSLEFGAAETSIYRHSFAEGISEEGFETDTDASDPVDLVELGYVAGDTVTFRGEVISSLTSGNSSGNGSFFIEVSTDGVNWSLEESFSLGNNTVLDINHSFPFDQQFVRISTNAQITTTDLDQSYTVSAEGFVMQNAGDPLKTLEHSIANITGGTGGTDDAQFNLEGETVKAFQVEATPDPETGMGYWENANETYPNDSEVWGTLANQPVRHHMFPEEKDAPLVTPLGTAGDLQYNVLGFRLENVQLPEEIKDQVVGYKIYYAKRDDNNKRLLDQCINIEATRGENDQSDVLTGNNQNVEPLRGNKVTGCYYLHPFNYLRNRKDVSGVTHLKAMNLMEDTSFASDQDPSYTRNIVRHTPILQPDGSDRYKKVIGKSYVDSEREATRIDLTAQGFVSPPVGATAINNMRSESKLLVQLKGPSGDYASRGVNGSLHAPYFLLELFSFREDLYNAFDLQILNSTNYIHTDLTPTGIDSEPIFGGDTFISTYTFRANQRLNASGIWRNFVTMHTMVCESADNIALRTVGDEPHEIFHPFVDYRTASSMTWTDGEARFFEDHTDDNVDVFTYDNFLLYNDDFSQENDIKFPTIQPKTNQPPELYPTRIIRNAGSTRSRVRNFLQDDFIDLSTKRGELIKLTTYNNVLIPHMKRALLRTKGREEINVGDIRAFLGSGNIFGAKPDEMVYTNDGFGGLDHKDHSITCPFGYTFYDKDSKKIYHLSNDGLADISEPIRPLMLGDYQNIRLGYDPFYERLIIMLNELTLSYGFKQKGWISRHSYSPSWFFNTKEYMYAEQGSTIYEHDRGARGSYYGTTFPTEYEFVSNQEPMRAKKASSLMIDSNVYDSNGNILPKRTFDQFRITNSKQDTGLTNIVYFADDPSNPYIGNARSTLNKWFINQFRDAVNVPEGTPEDLKWTFKRRMEDHYHLVKLIKDNAENQKTLLFGTDILHKNSIR